MTTGELKEAHRRQEERIAALEVAFAFAGDGERGDIAQRLQDATEVWWEMAEELEELEELEAER